MEKLIEVTGLKKYFPIKKNSLFSKKLFLKAVDNVSFELYKGETLGIVGESGSGKSTLGKCIANIYPVTDGEILYKGKKITGQKEKDLYWFKKDIQAIFQDPYSSLNPQLTIFDIVAEPLRTHTIYSKQAIADRVFEVLDMVGISKHSIVKKPYEFSGGQRQRISIARAIATNPAFILCDEPISALDVSIQAQIVNLLEDIQKELGLTYFFIAHNLSIVRHISYRTMVMYLGTIVEIAATDELYKNPLHPYTKGLFSSELEPIPRIDRTKKLDTILMDIPSPIDIPTGCPFQTRCNDCMEICKNKKPDFVDIGNGHNVACFLTNQTTIEDDKYHTSL